MRERVSIRDLPAILEGIGEAAPHTSSVTLLVEQVRELKAEGFDQFHFYTLNQAELTFAVCSILGIKPAGQNPVAA